MSFLTRLLAVLCGLLGFFYTGVEEIGYYILMALFFILAEIEDLVALQRRGR